MKLSLANCGRVIVVIVSIALFSFWLGTTLNRSFVAGPKDQVYRYSKVEGKGEFKPLVGTESGLRVSFDRIELDELKKTLQNNEVVVLDGRSERDYENGHIPGAHSLSAMDFEARFPQVASLFSKNDSLVVYCGSGDCSLSQRLAQLLHDRGYVQVRVYFGGYNQWFLGNNPVVKGKDAR